MREMTSEEIKQTQLDILLFVDKICKKNNIKYSLAFGTLLGAVRHKGFIPWDDDIDILLKRSEYNKLVNVLYSLNDDRYKVFSMKDEGYFYSYAKVGDMRTVIKEKNWPDYKDLGVNMDIFPIDYLPNSNEHEYFEKTKQYEAGLHNSLTDIAYAHEKRYMRLIKRICRFRKVKKCRLKGEWYWKNKINEMTELKESENMACIVTGGYRVWNRSMLDNYIELEFENHHFSAVEDYDTMLKSSYGDYTVIPPEAERVSYHDFTAFYK